MNTIVTSKEAILKCSRELVREKGILSLNIRAVAEAADISVGSVYTYYRSKSDLLCATIESIWLEDRDFLRLSGIFRDVYLTSKGASYTLKAQLLDAQGTKDVQITINGQPISIRGVNRHETHPDLGRVATEEMMRKDLERMKQHNINAVRTAHYPNDPRWAMRQAPAPTISPPAIWTLWPAPPGASAPETGAWAAGMPSIW